jgi:hypothetical protein
MTTIVTLRSELAHRSTDGIDVWLYWCKLGDRVTIEVVDSRLDDHLEFDVAPDRALDAFHHPYAYAPARALDSVETAAALQR